MIETERTLLRPLSQQDASSLFSYRSSPEVYRYQNWVPRDLADALDFVLRYSVNPATREGDWRQLGVYHKENHTLIGDCGFRILRPGEAEIGYTIAPPHQRQGLGSEVVRSLVSHLFEEYSLRRLIARTDPANVGSISILKRTGFRMETDSSSAAGTGGQREDEFIFSILREDWEARK